MNISFLRGRTLCIAIAMLSLWLAACAPAKEAPAPAAKEAPAKPTPQYGGVFHLGARQTTDHLDWWEEAGVKSNVALSPIYERLVNFRYEPGVDFRAAGEVLPGLAESWEQPNDTTYVFRIRKGVRWHDGTEFTAQDVAWAYEYMRDPAKKLTVRPLLEAVDIIEAMDKDTLRITTKGPSPILLQSLADQRAVIMPRHVVERGDSFRKVAIGTGPFKLKSFDPAKGITHVRNPDYWQKGKPYLDEIRMFWPLDTSTLFASFKAKETDIIKVLSKPEMDSILTVAPDALWESFPQSYSDALYMKLDRAPFNDLRVRKAMHLSFDRQVLLSTLTAGLGVIDPPGLPGWVAWAIPQEELLKLPGYRQPKEPDLAEAKRLLAEAGYPNGFRASMRYGLGYSRQPETVELLVRDLKRIGIDAYLEGMEQAAFQKALADGDFEMWYYTFTESSPERRLYGYLRSGGALNKAPINDPELDDLFDRQFVTMDPQKRKEMFLRIQRILLEKHYAIPTVNFVGFLIRQPYAHDWIDNRAGQAANMDWSWLWFELDKAPKRG